MRILMVTPRYGAGIVGGAENLIRNLATRAADDDQAVVVATTCATDHETWRDELPPGEVAEHGVRILRFPVGDRDGPRHLALQRRLGRDGSLSYLEELELMATSVWSSELQRFVDEEGGGFDVILLAPYLLGTTYWAAGSWPERTALVPCLHDEPYAHMRCLRERYSAVAGWLFNSPAEERLARRLFRVRRGGVVGMAFDPPAAPAAPGFATAHGLGRYLLYAGRLEEGKRVDVAVDMTARYTGERKGDLRLVLIGRGSYRVPARHKKVVLELGYLPEAQKRAAYAEATALVCPSELESLSIVLLEAWLEGSPALVAAACDVTREHCERSGGGLAFGEYAGFAAAVDGLLADPAGARAMGAAGRRYVLETYGRAAVRRRFRELTGALAVAPAGHRAHSLLAAGQPAGP